MSRDEAAGAVRALLILVRQTGVRVDVYDADPAWIAAAVELGGEYGEGPTSRWVSLKGLTVWLDMAKRGVAS